MIDSVVDPPDGAEGADRPWSRLNRAIDDYIDGYELRDCEDEEGNAAGDYQPSENEKLLITDAIHGLLADDELLALVVDAAEDTRAHRRRDGRCEFCGHTLPGHWGRCERGHARQNAVSVKSGHANST